jgi:soluble lytic murein transglycosylase-like protein
MVKTIRGLRLLFDARPGSGTVLATVHAIARVNPRLSAMDALTLADLTVDAAHAHHLPPSYLAATLLQESAYDPTAMSDAGAVGIAQFTIPTAQRYGIDPWNPASAIDGAARLLSVYVQTYAGPGRDPYALALAAYNAGPGAVAYYHGLPPYPETREYLDDIIERWSDLVHDR